MKLDLIFCAIGILLFGAGCVLAGRAIGGGRGQHKGDAAPFRREPAPEARHAAPPEGWLAAPLPHSPDWDGHALATPPEVILAADRAPEITREIGWRSVDDVVDSLYSKAHAACVAAGVLDD